MNERPYILLSCAMSIDGYLDDATDDRLLLSNDADFDRVDAIRASCDAILVGANTIRNDDPRLAVRSQARRDARTASGLSASPIKVTLTNSGRLKPLSKFFTVGDGEKIVYCPTSVVNHTKGRLGSVATVVDGGEPVDLKRVLADLASREVSRLMVEGGGTIHTQFLSAGLADELDLVIAPFFVGDSRGTRFLQDGAFPWHAHNRASLAEARQIGDVVMLRYALSAKFRLT